MIINGDSGPVWAHTLLISKSLIFTLFLNMQLYYGEKIYIWFAMCKYEKYYSNENVFYSYVCFNLHLFEGSSTKSQII